MTARVRSRLVAAGAAAVLLGAGSTASGAAAGGRALEGGGEGPLYTMGFETFAAGKGYWFTCPRLTNRSSEPVEVLGAELAGPPAQWRTGEVRAVDWGGESVGMGAYDEDFATTPVMREDHSGRPVRIGPGELSTVTYLVRAEPRSKSAAGRAAGCRITYRSAHRVYVEELGADFFLGPMRG
ncbi:MULTISPECIES: hypothetical protein [Streptomyces]|uniref:hypothetical protein n=2 Tax=Streptomyces TaxID=1883 RepID=UPI0007CD847E|nr:hypothetical protein A4V12_11890 [Streptomyces noursei]